MLALWASWTFICSRFGQARWAQMNFAVPCAVLAWRLQTLLSAIEHLNHGKPGNMMNHVEELFGNAFGLWIRSQTALSHCVKLCRWPRFTRSWSLGLSFVQPVLFFSNNNRRTLDLSYCVLHVIVHGCPTTRKIGTRMQLITNADNTWRAGY